MSAQTKTPANARRFYTRVYEASHGQAPRGYGRWIFTRTIWASDGSMVTGQEFAITATYTEAKKAAAKHPAPEGFDRVSDWTVLG